MTGGSAFVPASALAALLCVAGASAIADSPPASHPVGVIGNASSGEALAQRWCSSCHVVADNAGGTDAAPPMRSIAVQADRGVEHFHVFLARPHGRMPPLQLTRAEIADGLAYFRVLAGDAR